MIARISSVAPPPRFARAAALTVAVFALAAATALNPAAAAVGAPLLLIGAFAYGARDERVRIAGRAIPVPLAALAAPALLATAFAIAVWPFLAFSAVVVAAFAAVVWREPAWALGAAALLFGFEGTVKILFGQSHVALPAGNRALGAGLLDLLLLLAVAALLAGDRWRTPRALWAGAGRAERAVLVLLAIWLGASVLQIAQSGDLRQGAEGFRLFQAYTVVAVAAAVAVVAPGVPRRVAPVVLGIGLVVSLYAAVRVAVGPAEAERELALSSPTTTFYGDALRATGSFSSAVGLTSFLTPLAVFAVVIGYLTPRLRWKAWVVAGLALVGIVGSYGRAPLFAVALGLVFALGVMLIAADLPRRRKLLAAGLVAAVLGATYGGVWLAGQANHELQVRAEGVLNPFGDDSVQIRFDTWSDALADIEADPLGHGVGTVGSASADGAGRVTTTDNSLLKVMYEQGIPVAVLFYLGLFGLVAVTLVRLRSAPSEQRALGLAALAGFVAFLGLAMSGEYVEQPGKVVAWALLGVALATAFAARREGGGSLGAPAAHAEPGGP